MIHIGSVRDWAIVTNVRSWITSKRVSCLLSAAALVVATWGSAHAEVFSGILSASSPTMSGSIQLNLVEQTCGSVKNYPGENPGTFSYATHTFTHTGLGGCVTFKIYSDCNSLLLSVYVGAFDPANKAANYFGDTGSGFPTDEMSVSLGSGASVTLVVNKLSNDTTLCLYDILADITPPPTTSGATA
jgi:hypothetical protein